MHAAWHGEHRGAGHGPRDKRGQAAGEFGADVLPVCLAVHRLVGFEQGVRRSASGMSDELVIARVSPERRPD